MRKEYTTVVLSFRTLDFTELLKSPSPPVLAKTLSERQRIYHLLKVLAIPGLFWKFLLLLSVWNSQARKKSVSQKITFPIPYTTAELFCSDFLRFIDLNKLFYLYLMYPVTMTKIYKHLEELCGTYDYLGKKFSPRKLSRNVTYKGSVKQDLWR